MKTQILSQSLLTLALMAATGISHGHRILDANGNFLYDEHEIRIDGCLMTWSEITCKNVKIVSSLVRSTPEYQEGHFARQEQIRQNAAMAAQAAAAAAVQRKEDREERAVRAQELSAQAQAVQAINGPVQVRVNQSVSQSTTIFH